MRNEEIKSELSALRADVLALAEARKQSEPPAAIQQEADGEPEEDSEAAAEHEGFMGHVQELVELLEEELKATPVVSGLMIFSVGILVGRYLR